MKDLLCFSINIPVNILNTNGVLQCSDGLSNKVSNIIRKLMDNIKLLLICILRVLLSHYFFINVYMVLYLFIYLAGCTTFPHLPAPIEHL